MTDLSVHPTQAAGVWLADFNSALEKQDVDAVMALFGDDSYWRPGRLHLEHPHAGRHGGNPRDAASARGRR